VSLSTTSQDHRLRPKTLRKRFRDESIAACGGQCDDFGSLFGARRAECYGADLLVEDEGALAKGRWRRTGPSADAGSNSEVILTLPTTIAILS